MTLNGVMALFCVISPNSVAFRAHCVNVVKGTGYILQVKYSPKNLVFSGILLMVIFTGNHLSDGVKVN